MADVKISDLTDKDTPVSTDELEIQETAAGASYKATLGNLTKGLTVASGSAQGAMSSADKSKLDGIEAGATADQTGAQIKAAYEAEANTNAFTDADHTKLDGIEASADVTDETNVVAALNGATLTDLGTPATGDWILMQDASDANNLKKADFAEFAGSGQAFKFQAVREVTTTGNITNTDIGDLVSCDGTFTVTLVSTSFTAGDFVGIQNKGTGTITVSAGTEGINRAGNDSFTLEQDEAVIVTYASGTDPKWRAAIPNTLTGTSGQMIVLDGSAVPAYVDISGDVTVSNTGVTAIADNVVDLATMEHGTQGDILYYGASGAPTRLGAGTSGQVLKTQGAGANPLWANETGGGSGVESGHAHISVEGNATGSTITASSTDFSNAVQVTVFDTNSTAANDATPDHTNDHITIGTTAAYKVECNLSMSGASNDTISYAIFKNNGATQLSPRGTRKIGSSGDVGNANISAVVDLTAGDTIELWVQNESSTANPVVEDAVLSVIGLTSTAFELLQDTTPQLGGMLDVNGQALGDGTLELLAFTETVSAVNHVNITNAATGNGPTISSVGDDANVALNLTPKGTGALVLDGLSWPTADGTANYVLQTNGSGALSWAENIGSGLSNLVEDTTPQLGGQLDVNGNAIGNGTEELITFTEAVSAVNHIDVSNGATGTGPTIAAAGVDPNTRLNLSAKGTGYISLGDVLYIDETNTYVSIGQTPSTTFSIKGPDADANIMLVRNDYNASASFNPLFDIQNQNATNNNRAFYGAQADNGAGVAGGVRFGCESTTANQQGHFVVYVEDGTNNYKEGLRVTHDQGLQFGGVQSVTQTTSGAVTIDYSNGNTHELIMNGDVTSMTFSNPPQADVEGKLVIYLKQDATGLRTVTWPTSVDWPGGTAPTITGTANGVDCYVFTTLDGGTTWYGNTVGQAYA